MTEQEEGLRSSFDFLNYYLKIDEPKMLEYIRKGKSDQLLRISRKLYFRWCRKREKEMWEISNDECELFVAQQAHEEWSDIVALLEGIKDKICEHKPCWGCHYYYSCPELRRKKCESELKTMFIYDKDRFLEEYEPNLPF